MNWRTIVILFIIVIVCFSGFYLGFVKTNSSKYPSNLRITFLGKKIFVRWSSNESTLGKIIINGKTFEDNESKLFHKFLLPYSSEKYIQIKEIKNNVVVNTYNIDLSEFKNSPISVGIYIGEGADSLSYRMLAEFFENMNFSVSYLIPQNLKNIDILFKYDIIAFPGGRSDLMLKGLTIKEISNIKKYVYNGGSYMGICAGAYFASKYVVWHNNVYPYPLDLFNGKAVGPILAIGDYNINNPFNPQYPTNITWFDGEVFNVTYWGGPYFTPTDNVFVLAKYNKIHKPAAIKFEYGYGRVILFGFHPELDTHYSEKNRAQFLAKVKIEMLWLAGF